MPSLSRLALVLALLPCHACFVDLGASSDDGPDDASTSTAASSSTSSTSSSIATTSSSTTDAITSSSDTSDTSDPSNPDDDGTVPPTCGDGILDKDEACDEGPENGPERPCTPDCQKNVCGDGYKSVDEPCDDHNLSNGDGCTAACLLESCGDGFLNAPAEQCEDGNDAQGDGCSNCQLEHLRVFVSINSFSGDLMNTALADDTCAQEAAKYKLPGKYLAWLSTATVDATARFTAGALPYVRTDGQMFASSLAALTTSGPLVSLSVTVDGQPVLAMKDVCQNHVWTGTAATGTSTPMWTCDNFTSQKLENTGTAGNFAAIDALWTNACQYQCSQTARLYCFEQLP